MTILESLTRRARQNPARVVLPEAEDTRILEAAVQAVRTGVARPVLLGDPAQINQHLAKQNLPADGLDIVDPSDPALANKLASAWLQLKRNRNRTEDAAREAVAQPLVCAALLVKTGRADATLAGAVATTAETIRAAIQIIGTADNIDTVSSFFIMIFDQPHHPKQGAVVFADCALVVEPGAQQLVEIAHMSAGSLQKLTGLTPRVGLLSFSTNGSARHERVTRVREACELLREQHPSLAVTGELQFDAALLPEIAATKFPESPVAGQVNVFVFPSLEAGNIGYKIAQRIGGAKAIGPVLQGLANPANDLSRGCTVEDAYHMLAITSVQAQQQNG